MAIGDWGISDWWNVVPDIVDVADDWFRDDNKGEDAGADYGQEPIEATDTSPADGESTLEKMSRYLGVSLDFLKDNPWLTSVLSRTLFNLTNDRPELDYEQIKQGQIDSAIMGSPDYYNSFGSSMTVVDPETGKRTNRQAFEPWLQDLMEGIANRAGGPVNPYQAPFPDEMLGAYIKDREDFQGIENSGAEGWTRPWDDTPMPDYDLTPQELPSYAETEDESDEPLIDDGGTPGADPGFGAGVVGEDMGPIQDLADAVASSGGGGGRNGESDQIGSGVIGLGDLPSEITTEGNTEIDLTDQQIAMIKQVAETAGWAGVSALLGPAPGLAYKVYKFGKEKGWWGSEAEPPPYSPGAQPDGSFNIDPVTGRGPGQDNSGFYTEDPGNSGRGYGEFGNYYDDTGPYQSRDPLAGDVDWVTRQGNADAPFDPGTMPGRTGEGGGRTSGGRGVGGFSGPGGADTPYGRGSHISARFDPRVQDQNSGRKYWWVPENQGADKS